MRYGFVFRDGPQLMLSVQDDDLCFEAPKEFEDNNKNFTSLDEFTAVLAEIDFVEGEVVDGKQAVLYQLSTVDQIVANITITETIKKLGNVDYSFKHFLVLSFMKEDGEEIGSEIGSDEDSEEDSLSA